MTDERAGLHINTKAISDHYLKIMEIILILAALSWAAKSSPSWAPHLLLMLGWVILMGHLFWTGVSLMLWAVARLKAPVRISVNRVGAAMFVILAGAIAYFAVSAVSDLLAALSKA